MRKPVDRNVADIEEECPEEEGVRAREEEMEQFDICQRKGEQSDG